MPSSLQHMRLALLLLLSVSFAAQAAEVTPESFLATHSSPPGWCPPPTAWGSC
ncbi:hypothetical protein [Archangium lipolyticum]|uniref:hypothetical protein n=1 Tax=Archangium lipolyticum TaxID=2970465 RepID=UPI002149C78F|nr:hypothetical protein [Archangium lipolyticum]